MESLIAVVSRCIQEFGFLFTLLGPCAVLVFHSKLTLQTFAHTV